MSGLMLFITALMYLAVAVDQAMTKANIPLAGAFLAYALANFCFMFVVE